MFRTGPNIRVQTTTLATSRLDYKLQTTRDQVPTVADDDVEVRDVVEKVVVTGEPAFSTADDGGGGVFTTGDLDGLLAARV